jgi:hypothetical protein
LFRLLNFLGDHNVLLVGQRDGIVDSACPEAGDLVSGVGIVRRGDPGPGDYEDEAFRGRSDPPHGAR